MHDTHALLERGKPFSERSTYDIGSAAMEYGPLSLAHLPFRARRNHTPPATIQCLGVTGGDFIKGLIKLWLIQIVCKYPQVPALSVLSDVI